MTVSPIEWVKERLAQKEESLRGVTHISEELAKAKERDMTLAKWLCSPAYREIFRPLIERKIEAINAMLLQRPLSEMDSIKVHERRATYKEILNIFDTALRRAMEESGIEEIKE